MEQRSTLENVEFALSKERELAELRKRAEQLEANKPSSPRAPIPPSLQPPSFQPVPYPAIVPPDFGRSPWYNYALIAIIASVALFALPIAVERLFPSPHFTASPITMLMGGASGLLLWFAIASALIGFFGTDKRPERYTAQVRNSPEYRQQCVRIDAQNAAALQNAKLQAQAAYERDCADYENRVLLEYRMQMSKYEESELPRWEDARRELQREIRVASMALDNAYAANVIPTEYRNLDALSFILPYMESSQCDLHTAVSQYENKRSCDLMRDISAAQKRQASAMQHAIADGLDAIGELQNQVKNQLEDAQRTAESAQNWGMASAVLSSYAAYKSRKIDKQLKAGER